MRGQGIAQCYPAVVFIDPGENLGFAKACNRGIAVARGRNLLLLNPDAIVHPNAVASMVSHLDTHSEAGAVGARLFDPDGSLQYSCRRFPKLATVFFGRYSFLTRVFPNNPISRDYLYLDWDHETVREVDWVSGACLMVARRTIERVGLLDEGYFLFVEDMDWCRRIRDAGMSVVYLPDAKVTHRIGISRKATPSVVLARHRSMLRYVDKHVRPSRVVRSALAIGLASRAGLEIAANAFRRTA